MIRLLTLISLCFILSGCATYNNSTMQKVNYTDSRIPLSEVAEDYKIIQFDGSSPEAVVGSMERVMFLKDRIYVFDRTNNIVSSFSSDGKFIKSTKQYVGRARGEYISISDVSADLESSRIYIFCDRPNKIIIMDYELNFLYEEELDVYPLEILVAGKYLYCYCYDHENISRHSLVRFDKNHLKGKGTVLLDTKAIIPGVETFGASLIANKGVDFCMPFSRIINHIEDGEITNSYEIDFDGRWFSYNDSKGMQPRPFLNENKDKVWSIKNMRYSDNHMIFSTNQATFFTCDLNNNICTAYRGIENDMIPLQGLFMVPLQGMSGYFGYVVPVSTILNVKEHIEKIVPMFKSRYGKDVDTYLIEKIKDSNEECNPFLVMYKMK